MVITLISDIHANLEALEAVLAHASGTDSPRYYCLGDVVGYGPNPGECLALVRAQGMATVMGNHEQALADSSSAFGFTPLARQSLSLTRRLLAKADLNRLKLLPDSIVSDRAVFVHGCPPDKVSTYISSLDNATLARVMAGMERGLCFVGHTHVPIIAEYSKGAVQRKKFGPKPYRLDPGKKYIINTGSVGQPRDGDPRAAYVLWDRDQDTVELVRVEYDVRKTIRRLEKKGFPQVLGARLLQGL